MITGELNRMYYAPFTHNRGRRSGTVALTTNQFRSTRSIKVRIPQPTTFNPLTPARQRYLCESWKNKRNRCCVIPCRAAGLSRFMRSYKKHKLLLLLLYCYRCEISVGGARTTTATGWCRQNRCYINRGVADRRRYTYLLQ
jgi:hypothetical protein